MYNPYSSSPPDMTGLKTLLSSGALYVPFAVALAAMLLALIIYAKLFSKAGYSGWLALLMFVPLVNLGMLLFLAFSDWPVLQELRRLQERLASASRYPQGTSPATAYLPQRFAPPAPGSYAPPAERPQPPAPPYPPQQ